MKHVVLAALLSAAFAIFIISPLQAQDASADNSAALGQVVAKTISSAALGRDVKYSVYLPDGYEVGEESYPVLYLLHGMGGNETNWVNPTRGNVPGICGEYFAEHPDQKRIIVSPDAQNSWYRDTADESSKYETFFFNELVPEVEKTFRCKTDKASRAISGLSMGGYGCLLYALHHPEMFESCYAMSAAIRTKDELKAYPFKSFYERYKKSEGMSEQDERFDQFFFDNDPHTLVLKLDDPKAVRFLLDCGDDDGLLHGNLMFFAAARVKGVPSEMRVRDGGHNWKYWREALPLCLEFIAQPSK